MGFGDDYVINPLKYTISNIKALLIYTVLGFIPLALLLVVVLTTGISLISQYGSSLDNMTPETIIMLLTTAGIGFLIWLVVSILISLATNGYIVKLVKTTVEGEQQLPEWEEWGDLLTKGLIFVIGSFLVAVAFSIISAILGFPFDYLRIPAIAGLISIIVSIFQMLYTPLAASNYAYTEQFAAFFRVKEITEMMSLKWLAVLIVVVIVSIIMMIPTFALVAGFVISLIGGSYEMSAIVGMLAAIMAAFTSSIVSFYGYRCYATYYKSVIGNPIGRMVFNKVGHTDMDESTKDMD
ncbi:DUF4013 domain-containing protein [Methanococcus voltae]|jgi:hypothetical protein|uniref:Uncharacterized protein n=2 Tax=Methanococcus voltae TaxID=2188 RepID=A0A8J7RM83_METVO|nr:DUF4013 domain-containing protein [Methanococcus voltae]MBP2172235.1 hypothetical protein [Methanococcus voltae]MBP2200809.1 hypothetical protein [Methanococcus voltae]MCS3921533.1 hypothetical protein [Methanococcus voltae PS]